MLQKLQSHIKESFSFLNGKKLLLAVSGGVDSMVMVHLFQKLGFEIAVAHCNFQLRGNESNGDQEFVEQYAQKNQIPCFVTRFDTQKFADDFKLSIQLAARSLRYNWFQELVKEYQYDYLLTAHHADDNLETFLINLTRGTGLEGLIGIPAQNGNIVRPLLIFGRDEILNYAKANQIDWREDSSNASDKYLRNKLRHDLVPILKELNPQFLETFQKTQQYLQESQALVEDATVLVYKQVAEEKENGVYYDLEKLKKLPNYKSYLYQWLSGLGFKAWDDIYDLVEGQSGKQVFAEDYRLLKDRDCLILTKKTKDEIENVYFIAENQREITHPLKILLQEADGFSYVSNMTIFVDRKKLCFPLTLRRWKEGDFFQPIGMGGQSKKVSKFFKDSKMSLVEKEQTWLLYSGGDIVWIVGHRQDERFKVGEKTDKILQITLLQ